MNDQNIAEVKSTNFWNRFFFESTDGRMWVVFRICFGALLCVYSACQIPEAEFLYSSEGILPMKDAVELPAGTKGAPSIFYYGDDSPIFAKVCLWIFFVQSLLFLLGFLSRFQALCIFLWLVSIQNRCPVIFEGEDTVFRLFAFFSLFGSMSVRLSLDNWLSRKFWGRPFVLDPDSGWSIRLIQFQMTAIYASTAIEKSFGSAWQEGTALYYASRLHDLFGRFPVPEFVFGNLLVMKWMTWIVLVLECLLPVLLWIPRIRIFGILLGFALHLGIEYSMNLFLFQWIMMLGLLMFFKFEELPWLSKLSFFHKGGGDSGVEIAD